LRKCPVAVLVLTLSGDAVAGWRTREQCELIGPATFTVTACLVGGPPETIVQTNSGVEDFAVIGRRPPAERLRYKILLPPGATLELQGFEGFIYDNIGRPRVHVATPWIVDANGTKTFVALRVRGCDSLNRSDCELSVDWSGLTVAYPIVVDPQWTYLEQGLCGGREMHTATVLDENSDYPGQLLVVGGLVADFNQDPQPTARVELVDPVHGTVSSCLSLAEPRAYHTATWVDLPGDAGTHGKLLVVGGYNACLGGPCAPGQPMPASATYELYDPSLNCSNVPVSCCDCPQSADVAIALPDQLTRAEHTATVLPNLQNAVLVAGGTTVEPATALLFYPGAFPSSDEWQPTALDVGARFGHTATFVPAPSGSPSGGALLIVGGSSGPLSATSVSSDLVFEPIGGAAVAIQHQDAGLTELRPARSHSASLIDDFQVLLVGGAGTTQPTKVNFTPYFANPPFGDGGSGALPAWEAVAPSPGVVLPTYSMAAGISAIPALHGALLVGGLVSDECTTSGATPYFNSNALVWNAAAGSLNTPRVNHTLNVVEDGGALIAVGGVTESGPCSPNPISSIEVLNGGVLGDPCGADTACVSGFCVDNVCCNGPCQNGPNSGTQCQGCSTGQCLPLGKGTPCGTTSCGATIVCDGVDMSCLPPSVSECEAGPGDGGLVDAPEDSPRDGPSDAPVVPDAGPESGPTPPPEAAPQESLLSCTVVGPLHGLCDSEAWPILPWVGATTAWVALRARRRRRQPTPRRGGS
jgi:hypothetical protein